MSFVLIFIIYFLILVIALKKGLIHPVSSLGVSYIDELYAQNEKDSIVKPYKSDGQHLDSPSKPYRPYY